MHNLKEMKIWGKALDLCVDIYKATDNFPKEEVYGLTSQLRRAAVSISSNISEGAGRNTDGEFVQFLGIATGSAYELQTQIIISERLQLMDTDLSGRLTDAIDEILKMIYAFKQNIKNRLK